ncbi:MAG: gliding motility-associated C-terminal domain-containing protein, partial [Saprospiraceae bacterium]|nr:gliding motility-associated C-terminal domain-containing protein [Saprospiraceae bacterium]
VPIDVLGTEYVAVRGFLSGGDKVFMMATEDNTEVVIDGDRNNSIQLDRLEMYRHDLWQRSTHIRASRPIYVLHATGFGCEIGLALLPKLECTGSKSVSFTRSTEENFGLILITAAGNEEGFAINGELDVIMPGDFDTVPGTEGRFVAAQINLTYRVGMSRAFQVQNQMGSFHLGIINGGDRSGCRYGYFSDFKTLKILSASSKICNGLSLTLKARGSDQFTWYGDSMVDGSTAHEIIVSPDTSTTYAVVGGDNALGCIDTAYFNVDVFDWPQPEISISQPCFGEEIAFTYVGAEELQQVTWIAAEDTIKTRWRDTLHLQWDDPGSQTIQVIALSPAGCSADRRFEFSVGGVSLALDSVLSLTRGETLQINPEFLAGELSGAILDWSPPIDLSCMDCLDPLAHPAIETIYRLNVTDSFGCVSTYNVHIYVNAPVFVPNAFTPNGDGRNDHFEIFTEHVEIERLHIINRWGQTVFENVSNGFHWDGTINGSLAPPGVYIYSLTGRHLKSGDFFILNGDVTVIR